MTSFKIFRVLSVPVLVLALAACGGGSGDSTAAGGGGGATSEAADTAVTIADLQYSPADVEVAAGGSVTWTNNDDAPHTVSFDDEALTDSGELAKGDDFSTTFDEAGDFAYICAIHPDMKGTVTVQ